MALYTHLYSHIQERAPMIKGRLYSGDGTDSICTDDEEEEVTNEGHYTKTVG